jgi:Flp pilus assembly protein TadD
MPAMRCFLNARWGVLAAVAAALLAPSPLSAGPAETAAAREQARLCERQDGEAALLACRAALKLGIDPARGKALRELIAKRLIVLEKWDELVAHFSEGVKLAPGAAEAQHRLGTALLFAVGRASEALEPLRAAVQLSPENAAYWSDLAIALHARGFVEEARAAFDEALRLDPRVLDGRPAAQAVREAVLQGTPWP